MATRNRYAEIMAQYAQSQPFSFTGYPSTYTGGYDVSQPQAYAAPVNRYADIMAQPAMGGGRGERTAPSAFSLMSPAERAAYYRENPTEGKIALGAQDLLGNATLMGQIAKNFGSGGWYDSRLEKQGLNPESFAYGPPDPNFSGQGSATARNEAMQSAIAAANAQGGFVANPMGSDPAQRAAVTRAAQAAEAARQPITESRSGGGGGSQRGGESVGGYSGKAASRAASGQFGMDPSNRGDSFAQGGYVSMQRLQGPNPAGPDDGYAALKDGEYVINDQAVNQYGIELMNLINSGKISKGELLGLLEM
jgi:hypothetical protein